MSDNSMSKELAPVIIAVDFCSPLISMKIRFAEDGKGNKKMGLFRVKARVTEVLIRS